MPEVQHAKGVDHDGELLCLRRYGGFRCRGTSNNSSRVVELSMINHPFWSVPIYGNPTMDVKSILLALQVICELMWTFVVGVLCQNDI